MVAEDNAANMLLATDLLEVAGFDVLQATSAQEGVSLAKAQSPDLILMDIGLPGIDGLEATRTLKDDPQTRDIPIVAVTSDVMMGDKERILTAGCKGYIPKPIDTRKFAELVAGFLSSEGQSQ